MVMMWVLLTFAATFRCQDLKEKKKLHSLAFSKPHKQQTIDYELWTLSSGEKWLSTQSSDGSQLFVVF